MSPTPPLPDPAQSILDKLKIKEAGTHILALHEWGWDIQLHRKGNATAVILKTPKARCYQMEIDEDGNVTEFINGNYTRVVKGNVITQTGGVEVEMTGGAKILGSMSYVALTAPQVHLNPDEFKNGIGDMIPSKLEDHDGQKEI
jgi:hypothetical protein